VLGALAGGNPGVSTWPVMNRVVTMVRAEAVAISRFDHAPGCTHRDPERERADGHAVAFVEAGWFRLRTDGAWQKVDRGRMFVTAPDLEFSCAHDEDHPSDCCLSISFSDAAIESAKSAMTFASTGVRPITNRHAYLGRAATSCDAGDQARAESIGGALLASLATSVSKQPLFRADRLSWYATRVDRAKALIDARYAEPLSLSAIARDTGMSVFHFARVFAELEGQPPHRFLSDVRLAHAYERLRGGAGVTDTCFAVGFGSLSHFVTTFRRRYGVRPSDVAAGVRPSR
jgi:AraC-like DNA-binding protein